MVEVLTQEITAESVDPDEEITVGAFEISANWNIVNGAEIPFVFHDE